MKVKREYFILQERNRRLRKSLRNDEIKTQLTQCRRTIEINENLLTKVSKLKQQRLIIDLKFINLNIYHDKSFTKFKTEHVTLLTLSRLISHIFSRNELKSIKLSSSFATRRRSAKITRKKRI